MTGKTYIVEIFTDDATKLVFVKAETRAKAIKAGIAAVCVTSIKPAKARAVADATANDMLAAGKYDMTDSRKSAPVVATADNRKRLGALVGM